MSGVWRIIGGFPIANADWCPYWKNDARTDREKVKLSYYRYTALDGGVQLLAFAVNISGEACRT